MRKKIVAGNWKMNTTLEKGIELSSEVINMASDENHAGVTVVLCVPFTHLYAINKLALGRKDIFIGAQNLADKKSGAYTGEVSAEMIKGLGIQYVLVGHSERRAYYGETDSILTTKVNLALEYGITPIFCCGETLEEREAGGFTELVNKQIADALFHLSAEQFAKVVIAYEPVWAIGTGKTATSAQAQEMHADIRKGITDKYGDAVANETSILYGGSVNAGNSAELFASPDVDGGLVGGASLKSRDFLDIIVARGK